MADNNDEVKQTVELLEPVKDEKPLINKTKLLLNNLKDSRKNKKFILGGLGVLVLLIAIVLVVSLNKNNVLGPNMNEDGTINIETGTKWGDSYALYLQKELGDLENYDVSVVDLDFNNTPELLVKYIDEYGQDTLKIFYIVEGDVFSTINYHLYSIHLLYSIENRDVGWYIHIKIKNTDKYGAYTSLDKIINGKTYDSDINTNNEKLLEEFKRSYVDGKYKLVFYQVNKSNYVEDIKTVISRYNTYEKDINNAIKKLKEDNASKEYIPNKPEVNYDNVEHLVISGRKIMFGTYISPLRDDQYLYFVINRDGTVIVNDVTLNFELKYDSLLLENDSKIIFKEGVLTLDELPYSYYMDEFGNYIN